MNRYGNENTVTGYGNGAIIKDSNYTNMATPIKATGTVAAAKVADAGTNVFNGGSFGSKVDFNGGSFNDPGMSMKTGNGADFFNGGFGTNTAAAPKTEAGFDWGKAAGIASVGADAFSKIGQLYFGAKAQKVNEELARNKDKRDEKSNEQNILNAKYARMAQERGYNNAKAGQTTFAKNAGGGASASYA